MLDINNELFENLDSENLLPLNNDSFEVSNLIKSFELENKNTLLNTLDGQYETITQFIVEHYLAKNNLPEQIKAFITKSHNYKLFLFENIKTRMKRIIEENSVHLFEEIFIILNLLSNAKQYELLDQQNMFSIKNLHILLNDYEDNICELFIKKDNINFKLSFKYYLTLLEVLNEICIINSLDIQRRKNINEILELVTNSIANMKNKIALEINEIKALNCVLGQQLLYFTNIRYIPIEKNNEKELIKKYIFMLGKIKDGYFLLNQNEIYYNSYIDKLSTLILTLIYKLKVKLHIGNIKLHESKELLEIYNLYNKNVKVNQKVEALTINEFRDALLNNYKNLYKHYTISKSYENQDLIDYFISLNKVANIDMLVIHNIVLYSGEIKKEKLDLIVKSLLEKNKFDNDYYEFYKLRIIDRILQRYISLKIQTSSNSLIIDIIEYIEKNNIASHLMSIYSKIYLSLSLYFSYEKNKISLEKSKKYYFIYKRLDNYNFLEKEFNNISNQILVNYAIRYLESFNFENKIKYTKNDLKQLGKELIDKYIEQTHMSLENKSLLYVEKLLEQILEINEPNEAWLNEKLEQLIVEKIFSGLVKVNFTHNNNLKGIKVGYNKYDIHISDEFSINLYYSSYYKLVFEKLIEKNKSFLELTIKNIYKSYINSIPSYTDIITGLPNINKLKNELKKLNGKEITFIEIYLNSIVNFSKEHNVKTSNEFFKAISKGLSEKIYIYRLFGPKIGIIVDENISYQEIVDLINEYKITYENKEYNLEAIIAVSTAEASKILDKSFYSLSSAKLSENSFYYYK